MPSVAQLQVAILRTHSFSSPPTGERRQVESRDLWSACLGAGDSRFEWSAAWAAEGAGKGQPV